MSSKTAKIFAQAIPEILSQWEKRAKKEVLSALHLESLTLRDSLPKLLKQIVFYLDTIHDKDAIRARQDKNDGVNIGKEHGSERAGLATYTMDQMILEYHILRQVVFDLLEPKTALTELEREILLSAIEHAVNAAATQFNKKMKAAQQRMAQSFTHDLRSPLTAVRMSAERITKFNEDPKRCAQQALRVISGVDRLDRLVEDLLDSSLVQSGQPLSLQYRTCDLRQVIKDAVDAARDAYGNRFFFNCSEPMVGKWSEQSLYRVVQNLLTNAVKYGTQEQPITVTLEGENSRARLCVHNFGEPIDPRYWPKLFEPYQQGQLGEHRGYGLGLSVVKGLVQSHGGYVSVDSGAQTGTTFIVHLVSGTN